MSKRLIRIPAQKIRHNAGKLAATDITAVMLNGHTIFGLLVSASDNSMVIKDKRDHLHEAFYKDIYEIVYDYKDPHSIR